jgi:hypothetical protein
MIIADVEKTVSLQPEWLVYLKIKTDLLHVK